MNNLEIYQLAYNSEFQKRISSSIAGAASAISGENPTSVGGVGSSWANKRHALATRVINDNTGFTRILSFNSAAQAGLNTVVEINPDGSLNYIGTGSLDSDIDFTVSSLWDDVAGVSYEDKNPA
ncbi:hypothetical protein [Pseudoalteromonas sp.]|uniref:hypothetical protein n=1 Tax=Pseudoalteromonas sp. TaxID=53249 RepID=UPI002624141F|nr:hypothetical protein [Pseudoalteromonas sp.]MCP4586007.1 hypothetical protein [Pseudoalteromonas sp.]